MTTDDTIVAIATAPGEAAIAVTRLSGPDAPAIAARFFRGARSPLSTGSHRILFGNFLDGTGAPIDSVLLSIFRAPHSYTGENVVEISSHGGPAIPRAILETLTAAGARPARPGEFTERAYRNGKLDLAQAEVVASMVRARSEGSLRAAHATLGGELSRRVERLDAELVAILAEVESRIDFPGDVTESADMAALAARCSAVGAPLREWLSRLPSARRREEGVRVAIVGAPNVGKSSLLNALVGYDRAIVSAEPGTTRDTVEASIWLDGVELLLTDTAGLRETSDPVERLGVERSERAALAADVTIHVRDCSRPEAMAAAAVAEAGARIDVWNKSDLVAAPRANGDGAPAGVATVAIRPGGVDALVNALRDALPAVTGGSGAGPGAGAAGGRSEIPTTSLRQEALLRDAASALERAERELRAAAASGPALDLVAVDLTEARRALGEMVGRGVDDAVIAAIFSRFCIGK
ncbi:MAG TPA: tRNA uridine-5-carboxymethylaminomethyl(34) synthesis GTPase MnmE [Candidatus Eisenbacteria bacterium]|nr:tRNA uridine-5-carboxymethylaminomethyl(34) synthesis GTPase MnmE [Candidatus Eisenbacteria bacterium]